MGITLASKACYLQYALSFQYQLRRNKRHFKCCGIRMAADNIGLALDVLRESMRVF
jgi:hypothetical protein